MPAAPAPRQGCGDGDGGALPMRNLFVRMRHEVDRVVTVACDTGLKYLAGDLFDEHPPALDAP